MMKGPIKRQTLDLLVKRRIPVDVILDVGVLHGTPELIAHYPDILHVLFEPLKECKKPIAKAYKDVRHELVSAAVSDSCGEVPLGTTSLIAGLFISHSWMDFTAAPGSARIVPMITLDHWLEQAAVDGQFFLKIDIDGHEMRVLKGAAKVLERTSIIMIEVGAGAIADRLGFLESAGFDLIDICEPCYYDGAFWTADAVMVRRDLKAQYFSSMAKFDESKWSIFKG